MSKLAEQARRVANDLAAYGHHLGCGERRDVPKAWAQYVGCQCGLHAAIKNADALARALDERRRR